MKNFNAWPYILLFCFSNLIDATPSLLSQVKASRRSQFQSQAEQFNWASRTPYMSNPYYAQTAWNPTNSYGQSYSPYGMQQQYTMAPPPPRISPQSLSANQEVESKYISKALKLVNPKVRNYLHEMPTGRAGHVNPLLQQKKLEMAKNRAMPLKASRSSFRHRGMELKQDIIDAMNNSTNMRAANKTGVNIHRFRPGKWTNIFSAGARRRNFKLVDAEETTANATSEPKVDETNVSQIDLIKQNGNLTVAGNNNITVNTTRVRFVYGPRRRYGYKNFRQIQANSTDTNATQLRTSHGFFRRNNRTDLFDVDNLNETFKRPFGGRLLEKQLFRSFIQKQKMAQLFQNETESNDVIIIENETNTTTVSTTTPITTTSVSSTTQPKKFTSKPPNYKFKKLSLKIPKTMLLNNEDKELAVIASQSDEFENRISSFIKRVDDNEKMIANIIKARN